MKAEDVWRASFPLHYGAGAGAGGGGGRSERTFPPLAHYFRHRRRILIVKASSKRSSLKRKTPKRQDEPKELAAKEIKGPEHEKGPGLQDDASISSSRKNGDKETEAVCDELTSNNASLFPKREAVLKACITTSGAIFMTGFLLQQATHFAAESGWPVRDCTLLLKFDVESWQLAVICGLLLVVSSCRQLLLLTWPEFLESSDTANEQVLGPLQSADYLVVAIMPGLSEELLFRGALLPLCGLDWKGISITGLLFGVLHLTGGRKKAFAIWASFVGLLYGLACVATGSVLVPMVAHSVNNLIGAMLWRWKQTGRSSIK